MLNLTYGTVNYMPVLMRTFNVRSPLALVARFGEGGSFARTRHGLRDAGHRSATSATKGQEQARW